MTPGYSEEVIFNAARRIVSLEARSQYLQEACGDDAALRRRLEALLRVHDENRSFLQTAKTESACMIDAAGEDWLAISGEASGMVIGPYKLLEQIGEGGFGVVFMAEQQEPIRRKVAIKVLKAGMDSKQVIARFEAERQALALMDHPSIAKVLDAGTSSSGRPYFVMDLVKGLAITDYCDGAKLAANERIALFVQVCQAVQHAHQKGIIHRDIKPSNVLVTLQDGTPLVKVIDFGIAKALGQQLTDKMIFTGFAQMVGSPLYMSPEQAALSNVDVDTRSDIYSLGVLLYELLTGTTPFDGERLQMVGYDELQLIIREEEPPRPSTRVSTMGQAATKVSAQRCTDPKRLGQLLRGELDWIVMKAMAKERGRRYDTAGALAGDVDRYLHGGVVSACPPSGWYRLRKLARRYKTGVLTAALVALALVAGAVISLWQAILATQAMNAEKRALLELSIEQNATRRELARAQAAEAKATRELFDSLVAQARANRRSRRLGQRFQTLDVLKEAIAIARELELAPEQVLKLRNEAIAAMALPDLRVAAEWPGAPDAVAWFDSTLERYASVDIQGQVKVRRAGDGQEICRLMELGPGDYRVGWSPDGSYLALTQLARGRAHVWRLSGARPAHVLDEPAYPSFAFSPDSRRIALQLSDGVIGLFDLASGARVRSLPLVPPVTWTAFHPSGDRLALAFENETQVRELQSGKVLWRKSPNRSGGFRAFVAWHPSDEVLAMPDGDAISLWNVEKDRQVGKLDGIRGGGINLAFNRAGTILANGDWSGIVRLWDPLTGRLLFQMHMRSSAPEFSADDRFLVANQLDKTLRILEIAAAPEYRTFVVSTKSDRMPYWTPAVSSDGRLLAAGTERGVAIWDIECGKELAFLEGPMCVYVAFENRLAAPAVPATTESVLLTQGSGGLLRRTIQLDSSGHDLRIGPSEKLPLPWGNLTQSRDGRTLAVTAPDGAVVWHRQESPIKLGPHLDVRRVAVSHDGRVIVTGGYQPPGGAKVWDARTGKLLKHLPAGSYCCPLFSPDGKTLVTAAIAAIRPVRRWDVTTWTELPFPEPFEGQVPAFTPDGRLLVFETGTGTACLVDAESGREYARLEDPNQDRANDFAFSPDSTKLVSTSLDGSCVHVWDLKAIRRQLAELGLDW